MKNSYRAITGRRYDLDALSADEREFLREVKERYRQRPSWADFSRMWMDIGRRSIWKGKRVPVGEPAYRICQDLAARLGVAEGRIAPPDYRDRIADLIESRFRSRYEFCKKTGMDEGHLSRVLGSKKHLAPETLFKVLEALGVEIELVEREEIYEQAASQLDADEPLERLAEVQRRLARLANLKARAGDVAAAERSRLLGSSGLFPDELLEDLRAKVDSGASFDVVLAGAIEEALREKTTLAQTVASDAAAAEKAHRRAAS